MKKLPLRAKFRLILNSLIEIFKGLFSEFLNKENLIWKGIFILVIFLYPLFLTITLNENRISLSRDITAEEIRSEDAEWMLNYINLLRLEVEEFHLDQNVRNQHILMISMLSLFLIIVSIFMIFYSHKLRIDASKVVVSRVVNFLAHDLLNELNVIELSNSNIKKKYEVNQQDRNVINSELAVKKCHLVLKKLMNHSIGKPKNENELFNIYEVIMNATHQYMLNYKNI